MEETGFDGDRKNRPKSKEASALRLWSDLCRDTYVQALITREREIVQAMKSGAVDFLEKPVRRADLLEAIARATKRTRRSEAEAIDLNSLKRRYAQLTPRERQVFALVAAGLLNKQIAAELGNAEKTTKQHRGAVMNKMQAESLADLVLMAEHLGVRPSHVDFSRAKGLLRDN